MPSVEGMTSEKVGRQLNLIWIVHLQKLLWHRPGIVRSEKGDVTVEGNISFVTLDKIDGGITDRLGRMLATVDMITLPIGNLSGLSRIADDGQLRVIFASGIVMVCRHIPVITHPSEEDFIAIAERSIEGFATIVPFAGPKSTIPIRAEGLPEGCVIERNTLPRAFQVVQSPPGIEHCPARHTNRRARSTRDMRLSEGATFLDQLIEMGGLNRTVPQRANGIEALVVREKEDDVG